MGLAWCCLTSCFQQHSRGIRLSSILKGVFLLTVELASGCVCVCERERERESSITVETVFLLTVELASGYVCVCYILLLLRHRARWSGGGRCVLWVFSLPTARPLETQGPSGETESLGNLRQGRRRVSSRSLPSLRRLASAPGNGRNGWRWLWTWLCGLRSVPLG